MPAAQSPVVRPRRAAPLVARFPSLLPLLLALAVSAVLAVLAVLVPGVPPPRLMLTPVTMTPPFRLPRTHGLSWWQSVIPQPPVTEPLVPEPAASPRRKRG
jgi:hypothetical protein